ncbi:MAG: class I SAM-dependent methyltransferase [Rhizobiales bacterium]|nr:class I SAM-dependent methyltransferase [Hyphomicrobiales bacterium]
MEHQCTPRQLARIFEHIESMWSDMGQSDPMYSVFSANRFRNANASEENIKEFYESGRLDTDALASELTGHELPASVYTHCVELGCGLGRVTRYLSGFAENVTGYNISEPHLQLASEHIAKMGVQNVALKKISTHSSLIFKPFDLFYSRLVFQHNPPPIIYHILDTVLRSLTPGGMAVFQLPA